LDITGRFKITGQGIPSSTPFYWLTYIADYILLTVLSLWVVNLLKTGFQNVTEQLRNAISLGNKDRSELKQRVNDRTAGLVKKTEQLRAASFIARQTAEIQNIEAVLNIVVNLVTDQFGFYHAGIFLVNEKGDEVVLQAASSVGGKRMVQKGHSFKVGAKSIVGSSSSKKKPYIALDVGTDAVFFNNPDLPDTRSEMALPLLIHERLLGVLDIQSDQPQAFSVDDVDVLQTLADQIAIAIENMRLLEDTQTALTQVEALTALRTSETWNQKLQRDNFSYTYTPLGVRAGKVSEETEDSGQSINIPITLRGQKIGSISLTRKNKAPWSEIDIDLVNEVAYQTGLAVDNVRLVEDSTERARQEQIVGDIATRFSQATEIDSLLQTAARELGQVADVEEVSVYIGQIPEQSPQKRRTKQMNGR
jgi:GAF domain-containing protein